MLGRTNCHFQHVATCVAADLHQLSDANAVPPEKRARVEDAEDAEMWRLRREIAQMRSELGETESAGTGNVAEEAAECDGCCFAIYFKGFRPPLLILRGRI